MNRYSVVKQPADVMRELAENTAALRKQKGYSQAELARRSGVSLGSLRRFEQTGQVSLESLLLITQLLDRLGDFDEVLKPIEDLAEIEKLFSDKTRE
jgi:transcriptional regulator with XRE-family HTH domain